MGDLLDRRFGELWGRVWGSGRAAGSLTERDRRYRDSEESMPRLQARVEVVKASVHQMMKDRAVTHRTDDVNEIIREFA